MARFLPTRSIFLGILAYLAFRLALALDWRITLTVAYFAAGLTLISIGYAADQIYSRSDRRALEYQISRRTRRVSHLTRAREWLAELLRFGASLTMWPLLQTLDYLRIWRRYGSLADPADVPDVLTLKADERLRPRVVIHAVAVFLVCASWYGLSLLGILPAARALFLACVAFVMLTLASYLCSPTTLAEQFRRSAGVRYPKLLLLATATLGTVIVAFLALRHGARSPSGPETLVLIRDLADFRRVMEFVRGTPPKGLDLFVVATGALLWFCVGKALLRLSDLKRTTDDLEATAEACLRLGDFSGAIKWLSMVVNARETTWSLRLEAYAGLRRFDLALEAARRVLVMNDGRPLPAREPYSMVALALQDDQVDAEARRELLERWATSGAREYRLLLFVLAFQWHGLLGDGDLKALFRNVDTRRRYPLVYAAFLLRGRRFVSVRRMLKKARASTPFDCAVHEWLGLLARTADPGTSFDEDACFFREWSRKNLPCFRSLLREADDDLDRVLVLQMAHAAIGVSERLAPTWGEKWERLAAEVSATLLDGKAKEMLDEISKVMPDFVPRRATHA